MAFAVKTDGLGGVKTAGVYTMSATIVAASIIVYLAVKIVL